MNAPHDATRGNRQSGWSPGLPAWVVPLAGGIVFVLLAARLYWFVDTHAVNLLFWDQWDFYQPLFANGSVWEIFARQHGPHRQGLGLLITAALAHASDWNTRWDSFAVLWCIVVSALLAARLGVYAGYSRGVSLGVAALLFFNLRQYEIFVGTPNVSHGALPVALLLAACLVFYLKSAWTRVVLLAALTFLLVFTGFGLFAGLVIPAAVLAEGVARRWHGGKVEVLPLVFLLAATGLAWAAFSVDYVFAPAVANFRFPHERPWEYVQFAALLAAHGIGIPGTGTWPLVAGLVIWVAVFSTAARHSIRLLRRQGHPASEMTVLVLSGFSILFAANTAIGRVCLGMDGALASRYITLLLPAFLAVFLGLRTLPRLPSVVAAAVFVAAMTPGALMLGRNDRDHIAENKRGRLAWREAYLSTGDENKADLKAGYKVYPSPGAIRDRLEFLEQRGLNLHAPAKSRGPTPALSPATR